MKIWSTTLRSPDRHVHYGAFFLLHSSALRCDVSRLLTGGLLFLANVLVATRVVHAQASQISDPKPAFEVASIKRNVSGDPRSGNRTLPGGRIAITNQLLRQIIRSAYGSNDLEIIGGPGWIDVARWDIVAVGGVGDRDAQWRLMLQSLLADRFKLVAHVEQRDRPIYSLVFARGDKRLGPNIHLTTCTGDGVCGNTSANTNGLLSGVITGTSRTMTEIGRSLSAYAERRVFDRTGLGERYDFELRWSEDVSIFTSIEEQLGLKLESQRGQVDVILIDHVEEPTVD